MRHYEAGDVIQSGRFPGLEKLLAEQEKGYQDKMERSANKKA